MSSCFKNILLKKSGLLSLSQSDCDLFLIGQANAITYRQLALTGLHGNTAASGRFSIKHLEKEGYVTFRFLPGNSREKYYILTAKGRKRIEKLFDASFLQDISFQLEKKPPHSQQQLPHRIRTGDIYFAYLANERLDLFPVWQSEVPYSVFHSATASPRSDGLLKTGQGSYYIEQDDGTQGDTALRVKLNQYMNTNLFLGENLISNALIFTLYVNTKEKSVRKPPYSIYRILLKAIRVWRALEAELKETLDFTAFCLQFESNSSINLCHLSLNDRNILRNLCHQHPHLSLNEVGQLKNSFLYDTSLADDKCMEQDTFFSKRLRGKFYVLSDNREQDTLRHRLLRGMQFYVLPNHRLLDYLPYTLQREYNFSSFLERLLFHMGLNELSLWVFSDYRNIAESEEKTFLFHNVFTSASGINIINEDIVHDIGGRERVRHYLKSHMLKKRILFLLFVSSREDAVSFLEHEKKLLLRKENQFIRFCFLNKSLELFRHPEKQDAYFRKDIPTGFIWLPAMLEYDGFLDELHLIERRA